MGKLFFTPVGYVYGTDPKHSPRGGKFQYFHAGTVYGPFEENEDVVKAIEELWPNEKGKKVLVFEGWFEEVQPSPLEKPESEKRAAGGRTNYVEHANGGFTCKDCGSIILTATVAHSIHDFPGAGGGECRYEQVPYCPNCERKPDFHGSPIELWRTK